MNNEPASSTQFARDRSWFLALIAALTLTAAWAVRAAEDNGVPVKSRPPLKSSKPDASALWRDRDILLEGTVDFQNLSVTDIARILSQQFSNKLDVLVPDSRDFLEDPSKYTVSLRLRYATAGELFNAMNRIFEAGMTPLRWELTMNGDRPTAVLKVLEGTEAGRNPAQQGQQPVGRTVIYVGDLIGDEKSGGMTMKQIALRLIETYGMAYGKESGDLVRCHDGAELIIVKGTADEIGFVRETIEALKQKVQKDHLRKARQTAAESEPKPVPSDTKAP